HGGHPREGERITMPSQSTERSGRRGEAVRARSLPPQPGKNARHVHRGPLPPRLSVARPARPAFDATLALRRGLLLRLFRAVHSPLGRAMLRRNLRAWSPWIAQRAGEELVGAARRVLAFTAHPDDLEFFAGGTLR